MIQPDYRDARLVHEQIRDGIRRMITTHAIQEGETLPPVREIASKLAVNPNAVQRAYQELEQEGYVCYQKDVGMTAVSKERITELKRQELLREFDTIVTGLSCLSVGAEELTARVMELAGGKKDFDRSK